MSRDLPRWFFDEGAHAGAEHLDSAYAAGYEAKSQTDPEADIRLLSGLGMGSDSTIVDLGAGTGAFALAVAPRCRKVIAVDVSAAMLDQLRRRLDATGPQNIEVVRAGFLSYEHAAPPADFVYSRNALHHLPDFWKALALQRVCQMLRAEGIFFLRDIIYSFDPADAPSVIEDFLAGAPVDPTRGFTRADWEAHLRDEYSAYSWILEAMFERIGFEILDREFSQSRVFAAYTLARRRV